MKWNEILELAKTSNSSVTLVGGKTLTPEALEEKGIHESSTIGQVILNSMRLIIGDYLHVFGSDMPVVAEKIKQYYPGDKLIVATDIWGGIFAISNGDFTGNAAALWYYAPDTLQWENLNIDYPTFIKWVFTKEFKQFHASFLWRGAKSILETIKENEAVMVYPFLWAKECDIETASKQIVPFEEVLELNATFGMQLNQPEPSPEDQVSPFACDKAHWQWDTALKCYIDRYTATHNHAPDPAHLSEQEALIWEYAGLHIAYFLTWIAMHDFLSEDHMTDDLDMVDSLLCKEITGSDFLADCCDQTLRREDLSQDILSFVDYYYDRCYINDFSDFLEDVLGKEMFETSFSWEEYERFEPYLNAAHSFFMYRTSPETAFPSPEESHSSQSADCDTSDNFSPEEILVEFQTKMVRLALELEKHTTKKADKLYILCCSESASMSQCANIFFKVDRHFLHNGQMGIAEKNNGSMNVLGDFFDGAEEQTERLERLCKKHGMPVPQETRLVYDLATKEATAEYSYELIPHGILFEDLEEVWMKEEQAKYPPIPPQQHPTAAQKPKKKGFLSSLFQRK